MPGGFRVFKDTDYAYFITCTLVGWLPVFTERAYCQIILESLAYLRTHKHTQLNAYVLMPTHLHAILWPDEGIFLSDILRDFKRFTSRAISGEAARRGDVHFLAAFAKARRQGRAQDISQSQVWQEGSHPEAIFSDEFARQKLDYIHFNPVRAGLVEEAEDWPYSSVKAYLYDQEVFSPVDLLACS